MKIFLMIIYVLSISSCSSEGAQNSLILGSWINVIPSTQCTEAYTFDSDNSIRIVSLDEMVDGTYSFTTQANSSNRHHLAITITQDNLQPDCEGSNDNDVGLVVDLFVEFISNVEMDVYAQSSGGSIIATFIKDASQSTPISDVPLGLRIFVPQSRHNGDFFNDTNLIGENAVIKADYFCNQDTQKPGDQEYKALLIDGVDRDAVALVDWVLLPDTKYYRADGVTIIGTTNANSIFDVTSGSLVNSVEALGSSPRIEPYALTGISNVSDFSTGISDSHCNNYSSTNPSIFPEFGDIYSIEENAFTNGTTANCNLPVFIYCVEQL